jgi:hypothetical protein
MWRLLIVINWRKQCILLGLLYWVTAKYPSKYAWGDQWKRYLRKPQTQMKNVTFFLWNFIETLMSMLQSVLQLPVRIGTAYIIKLSCQIF